MKPAALILVCSTVLFACNKEGTALKSLNKTSGCIEQMIIPVSQHDVTDSNVQVMNALFTNSHIDYHNFRYTSFRQDSTQTQYPPYALLIEKHALVDQYANGLRIFNEEIGFHWTEEGELYLQMGRFTKGTKLNTKASLELNQLRQMFLADAEKYDGKGEFYKDTCLKAEFGYLDINAVVSDTTEKLIKAWRITPLNSVYPCEYPVAYYKDDDAALIGYSNGIQTFR